MRTLLVLGILALAAAIWYAAQEKKPPHIDPRSYHCDLRESLPCTGMRQ